MSSKATGKPGKDSELGTLIVVLLKARNLNDKHTFWKQDVFAQATLNDVQKRSHVDIKGGQHPEWDSEVRFTVLKETGPGGKNRKLEVACYAQEPKTEDLLGKATVDISNTLKTGEFDDWVSLDVEGVVRGDLYLEMTFYAKAPAPTAPKNKFLVPAQGSALGRRPSKLSPSDRLSRPVQQKAAGPSRFSPRHPSQLHDQSNPTSSHLKNAVPPARKNGSLLDLPADGPVPFSPQDIQPQPLPSILRSGLERRSSPPDASPSPPNPYINGSSAYTQLHSGLSNINGASSNPYTRGRDAYIAEQQHAYSPSLPGAFIPGNQPALDGRSYSHASRVAPPNLYTGPGVQASNGRTYSQVPSTVSVQVSEPSHPSVPISVSPPNPYIRSGGVYLPENQPPDLSPYSPGPGSSPVLTSRSPSIDYFAPTNPYTGERATFIPGSQQAPDGWAYSSSPPADTAVTLGYTNHDASLQANGPSLPYNASPRPSSRVSSGPLAFPIPTIPIVMEPYGYHEPSSSHYQPPPTPRTNFVSNNRSSEQEQLDPYHLARYRTPLPLPPEESPMPPIPLPPPHVIATPVQVSSSPPVVVTSTPVPDKARVEALRKVEQDAAWRREQELKDLELAMQLDRELNL